jgi:uncharacterized membrane protein YbaN (DUF454 family)
MSLLKILLISSGTLTLLIGLVGIVVPGIPTTPFLIITAGFYLKSSDTLYNRLISNKLVGKYILEYRLRKGMTKKSKALAIAVMWSMIILSQMFFIEHPVMSLLVVIAGIIGTLVMGFIIQTVRNAEQD